MKGVNETETFQLESEVFEPLPECQSERHMGGQNLRSPPTAMTNRAFVSPRTPKKRKGRLAEEDPRMQYTYDILRSASTKDECSTFAKHIAMKLRKFDDHTRALLMHRINTIIFEEEMQKYRIRAVSPSHSSDSSVNYDSLSSTSIPQVHTVHLSPVDPDNENSNISSLHNRSSTSSSTVQNFVSTFSEKT